MTRREPSEDRHAQVHQTEEGALETDREQRNEGQILGPPRLHHRGPFGTITLDGHILIVEGVSDGKYHIVVRANPPGGNFVDLCQGMLFMSGIDVRNLWVGYQQLKAWASRS